MLKAESNYVCCTDMKGLLRTRTISVICFIVIAWLKLQLLTGCANIIPPEGGPRDTIPPHLVSASPKDSTLNFNSQEVTLLFNEYVDLQDLSNNVIISPTFETNPTLAVKGKSITIKFNKNRDTLERNTTYIFNFGNAIKDVNEGNVLKNFQYTFSTGSHLDTATLSGKVLLAENGQIDSTLSVLLYKKREDSAVYKERPMYIVKLDGNGNFHFTNLPTDTFAIYALGTTGGGRRYTSPAQMFGFSDTLAVAGHTRPITLYAYQEKRSNAAGTQNAPGTTERIPASDRRLRFTPVSNNEQELTGDYILNFPVPLRSFDSSKVHLSTDSTFQPAPFTVLLDTSKKELRIKSQWKEATKYNLVLDKTFASDTAGRQLLKTDTLFFTTKSREDYGKLTIKFRNVDTSLHPVLQFVQENRVVLSAPISSGIYTNDLFSTGDYELRILYDRNGNGKWDPGQFFGVRRQPELVRPLPDKITVKAAWDNVFDKSL